MSLSLDRRAFLQRAGLLGAASTAMVAGLPRPPARADEALAPFVHGVASGDPTQTGVIIWTRVTPTGSGPIDVRYDVARDAAFADVVETGVISTDASRDHTVKVDVGSLSPGTYYWYRFTALGKTSIVGRTKTAPAAGVQQMRFAVVSCSNYEGGYFNAYAFAAKRNDLDAVIHLGDYIYEYGNDRYGPGSSIGRTQDPPNEIVTLDDYRRRYASYRLDPDLRRLHQLFPFVTVWDDHEITNDSWRDGAENHNEGEGDYAVRKATAQRVYSEWMPIRTTDPAVIYRSFAYGDLVELTMLDTRIEGRDEPTGELLNPTLFTSEIDDPDRELISPAQRQLLFDALSRANTAGTTWKVIGQQVMLMHWNAGGLPTAPDGFPDAATFGGRQGGNAVNPDAWDGYTAERNRLYDHIEANGIDNVVVLTGDIHSSFAADLPRDPYRIDQYNPATGEGSLAVEFVGPSVTSDNLNEIAGGGPEGSSAAFEEGTKADNPHIKYVDLDRHGLFFLDVTPDRIQADWVFMPSREVASDEEVAGPSWQVRAGNNFVEPADAPVAEPGTAPPPPAAEPPAPAPDPSPSPTPAVDDAAADLPTTGGGALVAGAAALAAAGFVRLADRRAAQRGPSREDG